MKVILKVVSGPSEGRQIPLQAGEIARFGRSDFADVCFPSDVEMAEVHFELNCRHDGCRLRTLDASVATLINDQPVSDAAFHDGDRIVAGQTCLQAIIQGQISAAPEDGDPAIGKSSDESDQTQPKTADELCQSLNLEESSIALLTPGMSPDAFITSLIDHEQFADAIRVLSLHLPKPEAIRWARDCFSGSLNRPLNDSEQVCMDAVTAWLEDPSNDHRLQAHAAAEQSEYGSPVSWVAAAVFWSGGSIAPPELAEVSPPPELCGQGVVACLLMVATQGDPTRAQERFRKISLAGQEILQPSGR